jgi:hypothetical protein
LLPPAAEHHNGFVPAGRSHEVEWQATEFDNIADGIEADAGG